jgi:hypothetical protein
MLSASCTLNAATRAAAQSVGDFATGYANASADCAYAHPAPMYVQPAYVPQYQYQAMPQHGTMTVTPNTYRRYPPTPQPFGFAPSYNINY